MSEQMYYQDEMIPYGTQLSFWDNYPSDNNIVFEITYCQHGCPFNGVYEARDKDTTVYAQLFGGSLTEATKSLLVIQKDKPRKWSERIAYYIIEDMWKGFRKIEELTGRNPLWKMSEHSQDLPSNYASQGPKC